MFSIGFTDDPLEYLYDDPSIPAAPGRLMLGKSEEQFVASLSFWQKSGYESHWIHELKALLAGEYKVALVVCYVDPKYGSNTEIWRVYRDGEWAHFQNQYLFFDSLPDDFKLSELDRFIEDRSVTNAEGNRISEWNVALRDIEVFLRNSGALRVVRTQRRVPHPCHSHKACLSLANRSAFDSCPALDLHSGRRGFPQK